MTVFSTLSSLANIHLSWRASIRDCFVNMCASTISATGVQHRHLASFLGERASPESAQRRVERFFAKQILKYGEMAKLIIAIIGIAGPYGLAIDRTNWMIGKKNVNYLVLSLIIADKIGIPLFWKALPKKGNSNTQERIDLLGVFIETFGTSQILYVIGDREFIGKKWFAYLENKKIRFYVRLKENMQVGYDKNPELSKVFDFFSHLKTGQKRLLMNQSLGGVKVSIAGTRSKTGDLVIICTNDNNKREAAILAVYLKRWSIETAFRNLKTQGFNLENTHMTDLSRLELLMAVVAVALALCVKEGLDKEQTKKIPFRRTVTAYLISIFQYGLRSIKNMMAELIRVNLKPPPVALQNQALRESVG